MSLHEKLLLGKTDDFTTAISWGLHTNSSTRFDHTETSMYSRVIGLPASTNFGGASLSNQTERYLVAMTDYDASNNAYDPYIASRQPSGTLSVEDLLSQTFSAYTFSGGITFSAFQTSLEDDGKHFDTGTFSGNQETQYLLIIDKNNLGSGSGSSSSSSHSLTSWAYSSQSATDPDILIDWATPTPDFSITQDTTDWSADLDTAITTAGLNKQNLINDFLYEHHEQYRTTETNKQNNLIDYIKYRIEKE